MMKTKMILIMAIMLLGSLINAQTVTIKEVPKTVDDFVKLRDKIAKTPEGGAAIFMLALKIYTDDPKLGKQCLVVAVDRNSLREGEVYKGYELLSADMELIKRQIINKDRKLPNSYIKGSSPENNYKVKPPYVFEFMSNPSSGDAETGTYKIFVKCSGADSPRPITLVKNNREYWKASSWSSVLVGIKKPPVDDDI
ncbi:MAG: hypothetical protein HC831_01310 [Chloroflexia bacterium]|nr:hypothetical protein [Chloroflexia bacterium]